MTAIKLLPSQKDAIYSTEREVLLSGSFRSGKSRSLLYALLLRLAKHPDNVGLLLRKTMVSLRRSTLQLLIEGDDAGPLIQKGQYEYNKFLQYIQLNGGGRLYLSGMDDAEKIRSMSLGVIGIDEGSEFEENEYLELLGRLSLKTGTRQIFIATNPAVPSHFLYQRFFLNKNVNRKVIQSTTAENPWIPADYLDSLKDLPDNLYRKFALGEWTVIEGAVYDMFDRKIHVRNLDDQLQYNEYFITVDIGYKDPVSILLIAKNGRQLLVLDEYYKRKSLHNTNLEVIKSFIERCKNPYTIIVDPSQAGFIATLQSMGLNAIGADNDIPNGIALVQQKLKNNELLLNPSCLETIKEFELYCYKDKSEIPVDKHNHSCFAAGTKITTRNGYKNIEDVKIGEEVLSFNGSNLYNKVTNSISTGNKEVYLYKINDKYLVCTKDHKIYVNDAKMEIGELCKLYKEEQQQEQLACCTKKSNSKANSIEDIQTQKTTNISTAYHIRSLKDTGSNYTGIYGLNITDPYQKDTLYITRTITTLTTILKTLRSSPIKNTCPITLKNITKTIQNLQQNKLIETKKSVENGINQKLDLNGISNTPQMYLETEVNKLLSVIAAVKNQSTILSVQGLNEIITVPTHVSQKLEEEVVSIILKLTAKYAELNSLKINILEREDVSHATELENITSLSETKLTTIPVYNLTVGVDHNYYANGLLVSNCDGIRYLLNHLHEENVSYSKPILYFGQDDDEDYRPWITL